MLPDLSTKTRGKELPSLSSSSVKWKPSVANRVIFSGSLYTTLPVVFSIEAKVKFVKTVNFSTSEGKLGNSTTAPLLNWITQTRPKISL